MKFSASPADVAEAVGRALASLPARPSPAIMGAIVIRGNSGIVTFSAYTWDHSTTATIGADTSIPGEVAVSGKLLSLVAARLPKREVSFELDGSRLRVSSGRTEFTLPTLDIAEYPEIPHASTFVGSVDAEQFITAVRAASRAVEKSEDGLTALGTISLSTDGDELDVTGCSRKRLRTSEISWDGDGELDVLLAAADLTSVCKALDGSTQIVVQVSEGSRLVTLVGADVSVTLSTFDANFPNWADLFPAEISTVADVNAEFVEALGRVAALAEEQYFATIDLSADGATLRIDDTITDQCEIEFDGEPISIEVNPANLLDVLGSIGDEATLALRDYRMIAVYELGEIALGGSAPTGGSRAIVMGGSS